MSNRKANTAIARSGLALQLGLLLLIAYLIVRAVFAFITPESLWTLPTQNAAAPAAPSARAVQANDFTFDPFNRDSGAAPVFEAGQDAPETTLNLKLFGLRAGENASAILQTPDNKQGVYSAGDEIINGVTLKSISPGFIVLSIGGRLEKLTFARDQETTLTAPAPVRMKIQITAEDFMREVDIKPITFDGNKRGFRVSPRFGGAGLSKYGLEDGDILLALGDTDLTKGQPDWRNIATNISRAGEIKAEINRRGKRVIVKVKM